MHKRGGLSYAVGNRPSVPASPMILSLGTRCPFSNLSPVPSLDQAIERLYDLNVGTTPVEEGPPHERPHKPLLLLALAILAGTASAGLGHSPQTDGPSVAIFAL